MLLVLTTCGLILTVTIFSFKEWVQCNNSLRRSILNYCLSLGGGGRYFQYFLILEGHYWKIVVLKGPFLVFPFYKCDTIVYTWSRAATVRVYLVLVSASSGLPTYSIPLV